ncbi:MAG TPA: vanadium-dependent haloperoxidase [Terriglobales bacterium]|nr:vanadium-dependent haloperoxidase [Terriglobales bacterium]
MSKTNKDSVNTENHLNGNTGVENPDTKSSKSLTRRSFLGHAGVSSIVVAAASAALPSLLASNADGQVGGPDRADRSFQLRFNAASWERNVPIPPQINNGDEARYPNRIGNYSQGLPHNSIGEVDPLAYQALLTAVASGKPSYFANIPLGGTVKLADPQGGLAFDLEGTDSGQLTIPPSPTLAGAERGGEMVEDYWMALARDIPFSQYGNEPITAAAIADLNKLNFFKGPKIGGMVTTATLFRGSTPGDLIGPYLSQFFLQSVNLGTLAVAQKFNTYAPDTDYLTDFTSWLAVQNGQGPFPKNVVSGTSYIKNGRDLGAWVHVDFAFQAYLFAAQWLLGNGAPLNPGNPYLTITNQTGVQTFGPQYIVDLLGEVTNRALKAMWYQKWFVHRALRPIAYGGLVQNTITGVAKYPVHKDVLKSQAIREVFKKYGSYLLPAAYPEGGPQHPSYAEGHGVIAGACVTALKAFFNETYVIPDPVVADDDGQSLIPYTGSDAGQITVGGELNKLANNVALGRDMAGVHWRSDAEQALLLGEKVTISILRDQRRTYNEPFNGFTFTKFNGVPITV